MPGGGGVLDRIQMRGSDDVFLLCCECEALWLEGDFRWDDYTHGLRDFQTVLIDERGLRYDDVVELDPEEGATTTRGGRWYLLVTSVYRPGAWPSLALDPSHPG